MSEIVPLVGEHLALDLVNTRPQGMDLLGSPLELRLWLLLQKERVPEAGEFGEGDLAVVHAVREATRGVVEAVRRGGSPSGRDLEVLNEVQRAAPAVREVSWGEGFEVVVRRVGEPGERLGAHLADAAVDLVSAHDLTKVRECEADDCVMLFLPANPRRRWCSASRCGNRVRVARHYQRHRA